MFNWGVFWAILAALAVRRIWLDCFSVYRNSIKWITPDEHLRNDISQIADDVRELRTTLGKMSPQERAVEERKARESVEALERDVRESKQNAKP